MAGVNPLLSRLSTAQAGLIDRGFTQTGERAASSHAASKAVSQ